MSENFFIILVLTLIFSSCYSPVQDIDYRKDLNEKGKVAFLPFHVSEEVDASISSNLSSSVPKAMYEKIVVEYKGDVSFINFEESSEMYGETLKQSPSTDYKTVAINSAELLGANAVLIGSIYNYKERVGSDIGVTSPAQVDFEAILLDSNTEEILWSARFSESQLPLLNNVVNLKKFLKRKGKWVRAEVLLNDGIEAITERLLIYLGVN